MPAPFIRFDGDEAMRANKEWGFSCGPAALAAVLNLRPVDVKPAFPQFPGYCTPSAMTTALATLKQLHEWRIATHPPLVEQCDPMPDPLALLPARGVARIQWAGPWTEPGANVKWAYQHTHWIASWRDGDACEIYDINMGVNPADVWVRDVVPQLLVAHPRATGRFWITHTYNIIDAPAR